jgi:hypothetical protein
MPWMADIATAPPPVEVQKTRERSVANEIAEGQVRRMLQSPHFARAETQRKLLQYLWEQRHDTISEYAIATEALGRNSNFDSTVDASVRVHISRLRRKLKDYYQNEPNETELLVIPTGTHQLMVLDPPPAFALPELMETPARSWTDVIQPYLVPLLSTVCLLLGLTVISLLRKNHSLRERVVEPAKPNSFWSTFLHGNAPIKIILPTPIFFGFTGAPSLRLRSTEVNDFHNIDHDPRFQELVKGLGTPELEQSYTVTWDTLAAIDIARYLDSIGAKQRISFDVSRDSSMMVLEQANVIMLGTHQTLQPLHEYLRTMNFSLSMGESWVLNSQPEPGEQARYDVVHESPERQVEPSIIALMPGRAPGLKVLLLQSRHTGALVSFLCSSAGSNSMGEMWHKHGDPPFFEMVVQTETESNHALRVWPVTMHVYRSQAPANSM